MKICLLPHPDTVHRLSYLITNFQNQADIEICFPGEDPAEKNADIFILEQAVPQVTERLLSMAEPPVIVMTKEGISNRHIRCMSDFPKQFPKLIKEITERSPMLQLRQKQHAYFYSQKDILYLRQDKSIGIYFRQGTKVVSKQSFQKITQQLSPLIFFPVGNDVFVNTEYVSRLTENAVILQNGQIISFEPAISEEVKNAFYKAKYLSLEK